MSLVPMGFLSDKRWLERKLGVMEAISIITFLYFLTLNPAAILGI